MAATSLTTITIGSSASIGSKAIPLSRSKCFGVSFNSQNYLKSFSGLKAASSISCESEASFLGKESSAALRNSFAPKAGKQNLRHQYYLQPQASSSKVAILGAAERIVAADLSHCNTPAQVLDFTGTSELANSLKVKTLVEAVADNCPDAFIHIISNPVNSTVPIAVEVLRRKGVYDPKKVFGVTTLDVVRANTFVAQKKNLRLIDVDVPVVGGHAGITILPLLSRTKPSVSFTDEEVEELTVRIQNAGTEVVEAKAGAGSATLSMAYAAARFVESSLRALDGDTDVYECAYVQSELTELPFFASRVKIGKKGVEAVISSDLQGLTEYEEKALEALKPELKASIEKGVAFAQKQTVTA
ncbi:Malate dehydrogenase, chloroplastic [Vitis vinifera]|uniref:Malate dehydrogenase n=1 Tax=Vitis vinifera TaxID=29760 RepID=A0A438I1B5_VITVI|nr:Malate dehydrogenase, chloroplastic [Vitis vinifera]